MYSPIAIVPAVKSSNPNKKSKKTHEANDAAVPVAAAPVAAPITS